MTESVLVEIWECQRWALGGTWVPDPEHPWTYENLEKCPSPEEILLPPNDEWFWVSNWRIDIKDGTTDSEGWEYAARFSRFLIKNRKPRIEKIWNSRARRRLWIRSMKREANNIGKVSDLNKALPRIQQGLSSIHVSRLRIEVSVFIIEMITFRGRIFY